MVINVFKKGRAEHIQYLQLVALKFKWKNLKPNLREISKNGIQIRIRTRKNLSRFNISLIDICYA